jgi:chromosome segregation ATPase
MGARLVVFWALVAAVVLCEDCSPDAKKLTALISNITTHLDHVMHGDDEAFKTFMESAVTSRNALQDRITRTQGQLDTRHQAISRFSVQLSETKALIANLELEKTEVQLANDNTNIECERSEKMFQSRQREAESRIKFLGTMSSYLLDIASKGASSETVTSLMQALPALTATSSTAHSDHTARLTEVQTLLQHSVETSATGAPPEEVVQQLIDLIVDLRAETVAAAADDRKRAQQRSAECSAQMQSLRDKSVLNQKRLKESNEKIQRLSAQIDDETAAAGLLSSDLGILTYSFNSKLKIVSFMEQSHQMRLQLRSSQHSTLNGLLASPSCCMCAPSN